MKLIYWTLILWFFIPCQVMAWDKIGHMIVMQIALDHVAPKVKSKLDYLNNQMDVAYPHTSLVEAAAWPDQIKSSVNAYDEWHFVDYPITRTSSVKRQVPKQNVVWAINQSEKVLQNPKASLFEKGMFLRFLIHFEGDLHQPLHCADFYNHDFPQGDQGGNLVALNTPIASNLHSLWDGGLGLWKHQNVKLLADQIEKEYPPNFFATKASDLAPIHAAKESYRLAKNVIYRNLQVIPTKSYIIKGQQIVKQRVALAGYRLANTLDQLFTE